MDCRAAEINEEMKLAAAEAIASVISDDKRDRYYIIPSVFDQNVVELVTRTGDTGSDTDECGPAHSERI